MNTLNQQVKQWSRRLRWQRSLWWLFFGLACGLGTAWVLAVIARFFPLMAPQALVACCIAFAVVGVLAALLYPWVRTARMQPLAWARLFDAQFGLRQRISTALEVDAGSLRVPSETIRTRQQQDAARIADDVDAKKFMPLRLSWRAGAACLLLLVGLVVTLLLPNPQNQVLAQQQQFAEALEKQAEQLEQAKQLIEQSKELTEAQKKKALEALSEAQKKLQDPNATPEQALAAINDAQAKLDALRDPSSEQRNSDLEQAGRAMTSDELTNELASAMANQNFDQAANQMRNLLSKNGTPLTENELQRVANQLEQMARQVQNSDAKLAEQLRDAAQKMREGKLDEAKKALEQASSSLDKAQQTQEANTALDQAQQQTEQARKAAASASQQQAQNSEQQAGQQNGSQQEGQSGEGQSSQNQSGQSGQGEDNGTTAQGQAGNANGQQGQGGQDGNGTPKSGHSEDSGTDNSVYAPKRVNGQGAEVVLENGKGETAPNPNGSLNTAPEGQSTVPYEQVYGEYAKTADDAIQSNEVPASMKDYVRDYFSSLDPNQDPKK